MNKLYNNMQQDNSIKTKMFTNSQRYSKEAPLAFSDYRVHAQQHTSPTPVEKIQRSPCYLLSFVLSLILNLMRISKASAAWIGIDDQTIGYP